MEHDFSKLCQRALEGDDLAYRDTFGKHHKTLFQMAYRLTRSDTTADDILQQSLITIIKKRFYSFGNDEDLRKWMRGIVYKVFLRHRNWVARRGFSPFGEDLISVNELEPVASLICYENLASVRTALEMLTQDEQDILALKADGISYADIAYILGVNLTAIGPRLNRALTRLSAALQTVNPALAAEYPRGGRNTPKCKQDQTRTATKHLNSNQEVKE